MAAGQAIHADETTLTDAMLFGTGNLSGLSELPGVEIVGGVENHRREGLVSMRIKGWVSTDLFTALRGFGIRTDTRKDDHYSGNILTPMGWTDCVRISLCHYNSLSEVSALLSDVTKLSQNPAY